MYRKEHPRPQFVRSDWENLNGKWEFAIEDAQNQVDFAKTEKFPLEIEVPFCPESKLSGIEHKDFMNSVWYRRSIDIAQKRLNDRVLIHFGAVDYTAILYINGQKVGSHSGGYSSFSFDITDYLTPGKNIVVVNALDDTRSKLIPTGKQSEKENSWGCYYTRTTGIWQTVWLEFVPNHYISKVRITPDIDKKCVNLSGSLNQVADGEIKVTVSLNEEVIKEKHSEISGNSFEMSLSFDKISLWEPSNPVLYDLTFELNANDCTDKASSYFGFRKVSFDGKTFCLNNKPLFLSQVLDQGFYPDGIYTAPSDEDLEKDIDLSLSLGFNGARLHEKVFEERFLYHCDKKGYLIWGEYPNWGIPFRTSNKKGVENFIREWKEVLERDYNHPSIIGWCPLNEAWKKSEQSCDFESQKEIYDLTKSYDHTRPVIGSSGGDMYISDIEDVHNYSHNIEKFKKVITSHPNTTGISIYKSLRRIFGDKLMTKRELKKLPLYISEFGGMSYNTSGEDAWGYNSTFETEKDLVKKYCDLVNTVYDTDAFGFCYTQLYDVEQEQNGLFTYDRKCKLSKEAVDQIKKANQRKM